MGLSTSDRIFIRTFVVIPPVPLHPENRIGEIQPQSPATNTNPSRAIGPCKHKILWGLYIARDSLCQYISTSRRK